MVVTLSIAITPIIAGRGVCACPPLMLRAPAGCPSLWLGALPMCLSAVGYAKDDIEDAVVWAKPPQVAAGLGQGLERARSRRVASLHGVFFILVGSFLY